MEKRKFIMRFAVVVAVIAVLIVIVLLQNNEKGSGGQAALLEPVSSQNGQWQAVPEEKVLLGNRYVQVTIKTDGEEYLIPELFRAEEYEGLYWDDEEEWLWVKAGTVFCYQRQKNGWKKYQLSESGGVYRLRGDDGEEITLDVLRIPENLIK